MSNNTTNMIFGIDTVYYYMETNAEYINLFRVIENHIEKEIKLIQESGNKEKTNRDITININGKEFIYLNKARGFYWIMDKDSHFKIGLKDKFKMENLHDIHVQLIGIGIYSIGIKKIVENINSILEEFTTVLNVISRMDLNCFINHDFGYLKDEMFVTRKKIHDTRIKGKSRRTETIYIGKQPSRLRIYDKKNELASLNDKKKNKNKQSSIDTQLKMQLMYHHFKHHGIDISKPIFNVEFELRREYLKSFRIGDKTLNTVEDALSNAQNIFKHCMNSIKLVDLSTLSEKAIQNNNKHRAKVSPIWDEIKNRYEITEFMQNQVPLEKIKKPIYKYNVEKFELDIKNSIKKARENKLRFNTHTLARYYNDILYPNSSVEIPENKSIPLIFENKDGTLQMAQLDENGNIHEEIKVPSLLTDLELKKYYEEVKKIKEQSKKNRAVYHVARKEMIARGMLEQQEQLDLEEETRTLDEIGF